MDVLDVVGRGPGRDARPAGISSLLSLSTMQTANDREVMPSLGRTAELRRPTTQLVGSGASQLTMSIGQVEDWLGASCRR
jgi:hypothetical protein